MTRDRYTGQSCNMYAVQCRGGGGIEPRSEPGRVEGNRATGEAAAGETTEAEGAGGTKRSDSSIFVLSGGGLNEG